MRLIWSKLASWRLFFLGKDLVLHFKQFQFVGPTFFNYIQHSKMQHFCSIFQLTRCIGESWLNVVFVVCSLGENLLIDLFYEKSIIFDTFQCSIHFRNSHQNFTIYNIFCIIIKNWTFLFDQYWFKQTLFSRRFTFVKFLCGGNLLKELFSQNWGRVKVLKLQNLEKANFAYFVNFSLGGNPLKDLFWQNWRLLKTLNLYSKSLKKQTLLILWTSC